MCVFTNYIIAQGQRQVSAAQKKTILRGLSAKDRLVFRIYGESLRDDGLPSYRVLAYVGIGYKVLGDKVILAEEFGEDWEKYENYYNIQGNYDKIHGGE